MKREHAGRRRHVQGSYMDAMTERFLRLLPSANVLRSHRLIDRSRRALRPPEIVVMRRESRCRSLRQWVPGEALDRAIATVRTADVDREARSRSDRRMRSEVSH